MMDKKTVYFIKALIALGIAGIAAFVITFHAPAWHEDTAVRARQAAYSKIIGAVVEYRLDEVMYASIYYTDADAVYIPMISSCVSVFYPMLLDDFGLTFAEAGRLVVVVYPDKYALENALGRRYSFLPMGVYYGGVLNILSPEAWIDGDFNVIREVFLREGPMIHEMAHYVLDLKTNGRYQLWFTEGVALYYEMKYAGYEWRPDLREQSAALDASVIMANFRSVDESLSYRKAFDIIMGFVEINGEDRLQELITELAAGTLFDEVYERFGLV
jgi:hypothetical protein